MQVFRLVSGGRPDRIIAFDSLPAEYVRTLRMNPPSGLPRHWARWLEEKESVDRDGRPGFYICDYILTNNDKEAWQNIVNYARRVVDTNFRLMDKIEDMAVPMAKDSRAEVTLEPEEVPIIPIPKAEKELEPVAVGEERPRRGRKPKEA